MSTCESRGKEEKSSGDMKVNETETKTFVVCTVTLPFPGMIVSRFLHFFARDCISYHNEAIFSCNKKKLVLFFIPQSFLRHS